MTITVATVWLSLCLALCVYAWIGYRHILALPTMAVLAALAVYIPTGQPRFTAPPAGHYAVLGADIEVGVAIRVLLKGDGPAVYYTMPYTESDANGLQGALDIGAQGGAVSAVVGEEGGVAYDGEPPVSGDGDKRAERPALEVE